jgi:hypothetical protein
VGAAAQGAPVSPTAARTELRQAIDQAAAALTELGDAHARLAQATADAAKHYRAMSDAVAGLARVASQPGHTEAQVEQRIRELQEMNQSFNMQYLQLQQQMQDESRRFSLLSNIMKTKHDTAKNSMSNLR